MLTGNQGTTLLDAVRGWSPASGHWPTPDAAVSNDGEEPGTFLARKERHATKTDAEPTRAGVPLALAVKWATPRASENENRQTRPTPSQEAGTHGTCLAAQSTSWATPTASEGASGPGTSESRTGGENLRTQSASWPTPRACDDKGPDVRSAGKERPASDDDLPTRVARPGLVLNPVFVEALMGWPLGWTDPTCRTGNAVPFPPPPNGDWATYLQRHPGTEPAVAKGEPLRTDRLRACGNGVVPAQAAAAFGELFEALGVGDGGAPSVISAMTNEQVTEMLAVADLTPSERAALEDRWLREDLGEAIRTGRTSIPHRRGLTTLHHYIREVNTPAPAPSKGWRNRWR